MKSKEMKKAGFIAVGKASGHKVQSHGTSDSLTLPKITESKGKVYRQYMDPDGCVLLVPVDGE